MKPIDHLLGRLLVLSSFLQAALFAASGHIILYAGRPNAFLGETASQNSSADI